MKRIKTILVLIMVMALCASLFSTAFAKKDNHDQDDNGKSLPVLSEDVQYLVSLGLLVGSGDGVTYEYSKSKPTRIQAFIVYLRLINEVQNFDQFIYHEGDDTFDDHHGHSGFVQKGMAFAKAYPKYNWIGSNGRFNPMAHLTAKEYAKVLLTALGYTVPEDFTWNTVESVAEKLGLNVPEGAFTFEVFASMTVQALNLYMKDSTTQRLIDRLGLSPTTPDTTAPTVTDVVLSAPYIAGPPVVNGQVTIYFSEAMKTDTLKNLANYDIDLDGTGGNSAKLLSLMTGGAAVPAADRKSVTLTIPDSTLSGGTALGAGITAITITGLQDLSGKVIEPVTQFVRKAASLTVTSSPAAIAVNKLQVTFTNPMKTIDSTEFKLYKPDGVTLASVGTGYTIDATGKIVTITLGVSLTSSAKVTESDLTAAMLAIGTTNTKDIFGNVVSGDVAVHVVSTSAPAKVMIQDKIAPAVATLAKGTAAYTFDMTFTEPVNAIDAATLAAALKITSLSGAAQTAVYSFSVPGETINKFTKLTVTLSGAYENKYNIELLGQGLKDASANIVKAFAKTTLTVLTNDLPVITTRQTQDLDNDGHLDAIKLTFNKNIKDSSVVAGDFNVSDYVSEAFVPTIAGDTADNNIIYITFTELSIGDTGATPTIAYTQGSLEDLTANKLATTGAVASTDKAAPAVITWLTVGTLTAGGTVSSAVLELSEDLTAANRVTVADAVRAKIVAHDLETLGDISWTYVWTTNRLLTVSITANANGGTNPDKLVLSAAEATLIDAAGNTSVASKVIK